MAFSRMLRRAALVRTDISEELNVSIIRVTRIDELGTLAVTSNRRTLHGLKRYEAQTVKPVKTRCYTTTHKRIREPSLCSSR
jgi:hypothetical protein